MPHKNINFAKKLRTNQTDAELRVWQALRAGRLMNYKFKRQVPIAEFITDFVCFEQKLIIEIDGGQHLGSTQDAFRDAKLKAMGFRVIRFWNNDVMQNLEGILMVVLQQLQTSTPLPSPLPQGEREVDDQ
jgi:very-short-patch-repair endonuclease